MPRANGLLKKAYPSLYGMKLRNSQLLVLSVVLAVATLGACGSIPDLKSFADATNDIRSGVVAIGNEFSSSIPDEKESRCTDASGANTSCRAKFDEAWKVRVLALGAIADYSDSLAQVAAAGRDGAARAEEVVASATTLLSVVNATVPGAIAQAATRGLAELAKARALRSMAEAIEAAHSPIKEMFDAIDQDLAILEKTNQEVAAGMRALAEKEDKEQVGSVIEQANSVATLLRTTIRDDYRNLKITVENLAAVRSNKQPAAGGCRTEADCVQMLQETDRRIGGNRTQLTAIERDLESLKKAYSPTQAKKDTVDAQAGQIRRTIVQVRSGLNNWLAIHRSLGADVRRGLQPNVRQLVATAAEIQKLVDDMRKKP